MDTVTHTFLSSEESCAQQWNYKVWDDDKLLTDYKVIKKKRLPRIWHKASIILILLRNDITKPYRNSLSKNPWVIVFVAISIRRQSIGVSISPPSTIDRVDNVRRYVTNRTRWFLSPFIITNLPRTIVFRSLIEYLSIIF